MGWTTSDLIDLTGRRVVVTGANTGLGAAAATALASRGADVTLAVRTPQRAEGVLADIQRSGGHARIEQLDLASLDSIRAFASRIDGPIDLLLNNAGVMAPRQHGRTVDGFETQFGTNHLGHFALTGLLMPRLLDAESPRVTTVASIAHQRGDGGVLAGNPPEGYSPQKSYGQSKLANVLFAQELHRRASAASSRLTSTAAHPGVSNTELLTRSEGMGAMWVVRTLGPSVMGLFVPGPERSCESLLYAATVGSPGSYTGPKGPAEVRGAPGPARLSRYAKDEQLAQALWTRSEELTGVRYPTLT